MGSLIFFCFGLNGIPTHLFFFLFSRTGFYFCPVFTCNTASLKQKSRENKQKFNKTNILICVFFKSAYCLLVCARHDIPMHVRPFECSPVHPAHSASRIPQNSFDKHHSFFLCCYFFNRLDFFLLHLLFRVHGKKSN